MSATTDLERVLARHNVGISGDELVAELDDALSVASSPASEPLSETEATFVRAYGGPQAVGVLDEDPGQIARQLSQAVARQTVRAIVSTLSIVEAAALLGVDRSRISQLVSRHRLWAFRLGRSKRIPRWQFTGAAVLPGLDQVVAAIPSGLAPQSVAGFMTTPQPELDEVAPVTFLVGGGDPKAVAKLLAGLGRW